MKNRLFKIQSRRNRKLITDAIVYFLLVSLSVVFMIVDSRKNRFFG